MKKTVFYVIAVLIVLMFLMEVTALGIFPYLIALFLMYQSLFQKKDRTTALGVMAIIMGLLNLLLMFDDIAVILDVMAWMGILAAYGVEKK